MAKERPILFSGEMVRAILEGRKTQTRRIVKPQPIKFPPEVTNARWLDDGYTEPGFYAYGEGDKPAIGYWRKDCPHGQPGDRLWVRETWQPYWDDSDLYMAIRYKADGLFLKPKNLDEHQGHAFAGMFEGWAEDQIEGPWKPLLYMPRWASRILLEITDVRVERVQDIGEADAEAEGAQVVCGECGEPFCVEANAMGYCWRPDCKGSEDFSYEHGFKFLWNSINEKRGFGYEANPWVWVVEFKRVEA